jgi:hypothetical protein
MTITIPDGVVQEVMDSMAAVYSIDPTAAGTKAFIISLLKQAVMNTRLRTAKDAAYEGIDTDDVILS